MVQLIFWERFFFLFVCFSFFLFYLQYVGSIKTLTRKWSVKVVCLSQVKSSGVKVIYNESGEKECLLDQLCKQINNNANGSKSKM